MCTIIQATKQDAIVIHQLVHQIYYPTYKDILSVEQINFMLHKSYTEEALKDAMASGQDFFILWADINLPIGFMSVAHTTTDILRIEKLYLLPSTQGKGYGLRFINFALEEAKKRNLTTLELNVNRGNKAYHFYLKQGFTVSREVDIPYYGYVLDDYVMQKPVT